MEVIVQGVTGAPLQSTVLPSVIAPIWPGGQAGPARVCCVFPHVQLLDSSVHAPQLPDGHTAVRVWLIVPVRGAAQATSRFSVLFSQVQLALVCVHPFQLQDVVFHVRVSVTDPVKFTGHATVRVSGNLLIQVQVLPVVTQGPTFAVLPAQVTVCVCEMAPVWLGGQGCVLAFVAGWQTQAARLVVFVVVPDGQTVVVVVVVLPV